MSKYQYQTLSFGTDSPASPDWGSLFKMHYPEYTCQERLEIALRREDSMEARGEALKAAMKRIAELKTEIDLLTQASHMRKAEREAAEAAYMKVIDMVTGGSEEDDNE